ncbi:MAG: cupredoxin domain-containing protein [Polyangiaceae bacterium]
MNKGFLLLFLGFALALPSACGSEAKDRDSSCQPDDQDGVVGGTMTVLLTVSDTGFAVGAPGSGSTQRNITVENSSTVKLTVTNVGKKPHSFVVACIPSGLPAACPQTSCLPDEANIPAIDPGESVSVTFHTPAVEGAYQFTSDVNGDVTIDKDGTVRGLVGEFVLT